MYTFRGTNLIVIILGVNHYNSVGKRVGVDCAAEWLKSPQLLKILNRCVGDLHKQVHSSKQSGKYFTHK